MHRFRFVPDRGDDPRGKVVGRVRDIYWYTTREVDWASGDYLLPTARVRGLGSGDTAMATKGRDLAPKCATPRLASQTTNTANISEDSRPPTGTSPTNWLFAPRFWRQPPPTGYAEAIALGAVAAAATFFSIARPGVEFRPGHPGSSGRPAKPTLLYLLTARRPDRTRSRSRDFSPSPTTRPTGTSPTHHPPLASLPVAKSSPAPNWHLPPACRSLLLSFAVLDLPQLAPSSCLPVAPSLFFRKVLHLPQLAPSSCLPVAPSLFFRKVLHLPQLAPCLPRSSLQGRLPWSAAPRASPVPRDWAFRAAPSGAPALPGAPNGGVNKSSQGSG